ncbi:glucose-6-phosphatase 2 [Neodiprion fabricii]|uniref:glucose-6-phosphatase 2 n=1 Tax=Neodiprion fabricii TaxID=2872261 RepID=UPI001ED91B11|nr:glucose-6-phosphatase 2 [Neodiprion fabricii]XP_046420693.1 glucose-6-phosphatase 2 [Neodiprion fabricii]
MHPVEALYEIGAAAIDGLQNMFPDSDRFFLTVTKVADPDYAFSILVPLFVILSPKLSSDILIVSFVSEWCNILLKWLLMEHRPYWWVKERELLTKHPVPLLRQTHLTCETGPGSPSGHVMGSAAVLFAIVHFTNESLSRHQRISKTTNTRIKFFLWLLFGILLFLVSASRLYVAAHFPHQCILGGLGGVLIAQTFLCNYRISTWWRHSRRPKLLLAALGMTMISFGSYWLQKGLGMDPQWSVKLAFKWCTNPEWIHVNTTPLFSLVRVSGAAFGLALIAPVRSRISHSAQSSSYIVKGALICSLTIALQLAQSAIPTDRVLPFYLCVFMLYAVQPYMYLVAVPFMTSDSPTPGLKVE